MSNELELGQMLFGNPAGEYKTPGFVIDMIERLVERMSYLYELETGREWDNTLNISLWDMEYRTYNWGEDEEECAKPNFYFNGVEARWYKHIGRGDTCNVKQTKEEWKQWYNNCMTHLFLYEAKIRNVQIDVKLL